MARRVTVQDDGPGFSEESLTRAFHRFFRGPEESSSSEGVGLGLALVRRIVERHGGQISYEPLGPGARFVVRLPIGEGAE